MKTRKPEDNERNVCCAKGETERYRTLHVKKRKKEKTKKLSEPPRLRGDVAPLPETAFL
jgi:hypothetical protein